MTRRVFGSGYNSVYGQNKLTLGICVPLEAYTNSPVPDMLDQPELVKKVEQGGFAALWCRDVPLLDPGFGDAGQIYDPWVWLGYLSTQTSTIALGTGSIILPLRPPVDIAKAATSVDQLTCGRLILGVATGDRPVEYQVYNEEFDRRDQAFRDALGFVRSTSHRPPDWNNQFAVNSRQVDLLPKCYAGDIPILVTGNSRQSPEWIAQHSDGWLMYPRPLQQQRKVLVEWQASLASAGEEWKPFSQSLYIDLTDDPDHPARPIHLGFRLGRNTLIEHLASLREVGVNHVLFNIRFSSRPVVDVLDELIEYVVPHFPTLR